MLPTFFTVNVLVNFYADRLQDAACVLEVLQGILALICRQTLVRDQVQRLLKGSCLLNFRGIKSFPMIFLFFFFFSFFQFSQPVFSGELAELPTKNPLRGLQDCCSLSERSPSRYASLSASSFSCSQFSLASSHTFGERICARLHSPHGRRKRSSKLERGFQHRAAAHWAL